MMYAATSISTETSMRVTSPLSNDRIKDRSADASRYRLLARGKALGGGGGQHRGCTTRERDDIRQCSVGGLAEINGTAQCRLRHTNCSIRNPLGYVTRLVLPRSKYS